MMALSQALAAAKSMVRLNAQMVNAIAFGPSGHDRYSGAWISLALQHLDAMTGLLVPEAKNWPSAFALSRVATDAALRSVHLGFGDSAPNFPRRYNALIEDMPNPFGGPKDFLGEIREALNTHSSFVAWRGANPEANEAILFNSKQIGVHSATSRTVGETQARFALHQVRTGEPPHEHIRTMVIFATTRVVERIVVAPVCPAWATGSLQQAVNAAGLT